MTPIRAGTVLITNAFQEVSSPGRLGNAGDRWMTSPVMFALRLPTTIRTPPIPVQERLIIIAEFNSRDEVRDMCLDWFERLTSHVFPLGRAVLDDMGAQAPVVGVPGARAEPWGQPGAWLGRGWVARWGGAGRARLVAEDLGWSSDLPQQLAEAVSTSADFGRLSMDLLDGSGQIPMVPALGGVDHLHLEVERIKELPGLAKFSTAIAEEQLTGADGDGVQQRWFDALAAWSKGRRVRWGGMDLATNIFTLLEETAPQLHAWDTLREDEWIRGFGWLTWLSPNHVKKLGGLAALAASPAFASVTETSGGGALLKATRDYRTYYAEASVLAVQAALRPVIQPSTRHRPRRLDPSHPAYDAYHEYALDRSLIFDTHTGDLA